MGDFQVAIRGRPGSLFLIFPRLTKIPLSCPSISVQKCKNEAQRDYFVPPPQVQPALLEPPQALLNRLLNICLFGYFASGPRKR